MARPILMPQVGQDLTEGKVTAIHVKVGDRVKKGDIVADVESEKATFEVECFETGIILEIRHAVGDNATVLEPLMMVGEEGETLGQATQAEPVAKQEAAVPAAAGAETAMIAPQQPAFRTGGGSSPLARRLAAQAGLDLAVLSGTGPRGAVVKRDVEAMLARGDAPRPVALHHSTHPPLARGAASLPEGRLDMRILQAGTGDPVVLVHGFGGDLSSWRPLLVHFNVANPLIALDLPAHGGSADVPADDFEALSSIVLDDLVARGLTRLHLVGHSLGAAVAIAVAASGRLDVRSLTLLSPAGLGPRIHGDYVEGFLSATDEASLNPWLAELFSSPDHLPAALARATLASRSDSGLVAAQRRLARGLFAGNTQLFSVRAALEQQSGPVRAIVGQDDRIIPPTDIERAGGHVAVHRLGRVGHLPQLEAAGLTGRLISDTIRSGS